jgi:hypothetical protein
MCDKKSGENRSWFQIIRHGALELALKEIFALLFGATSSVDSYFM